MKSETAVTCTHGHFNHQWAHTYTLQKQFGCFNHRVVVTMVADKLKRQ